MTPSAKRYAIGLRELAQGLDEKRQAAVAEAFADLLRKRHQSRLLPKILEAYEALARAEHGELDVEVTTAAELGLAEAEGIAAALGRATGRPVELRRRTNPALLGGAVIRYGDTLLDASLKRRLERLRQSLTA